MNRKRLETETFADYRENLKNEKGGLKVRLAGSVVWPSRSFGPARKVVIGGKPHYVNGHNKVCLV